MNLVRWNLLSITNRQLIAFRTHFTKTPNHHTKAKWRPYRREKVLDVNPPASFFVFLDRKLNDLSIS